MASGRTSTLAEVQAVAEEMIGKFAGADLAEGGLFPYGITRIAVSVTSGEVGITVEASGPDQPHPHDEHDDDEEWEIEEDFEADEDDE